MTNDQLGFDLLLAETDRINEKDAQLRKLAHLPGTMKDALPYMRTLIERHHAAMLEGDTAQAIALRREAHDLALRLNDGEPGIIADDDAPGCVLARRTAAKPGIVPLWGQQGEFTIDVEGVAIRIKMDGVFGIGATFMYWLGFSATAVDQTKPFISGTGYRSFLGLNAPIMPALTVDAFAREVIEAFIRRELKGKLVPLQPR